MSRRPATERRAAAGTAVAARPKSRATAPAKPAGSVPAWIAIPLAFVALLAACRMAPLGTAVADDYAFLDRLLRHAVDPFDSMGATFYWRPVSRQLYYTLIGPWMLEAPWAVALLHGALLALTALLAYRIVRHYAAPGVAAAAAAFVLLSEPARALLTWPSGAQHLLAGVFALLAVHQAIAGRLGVAAAAALLGVLSHESAVLALPALPLVAWAERRGPRATTIAAGTAAAVVVAWAAGYLVARAHGVHLPSGGESGGTDTPIARLPLLAAHALAAALSLEDVHGTTFTVLATLMAVTAAIGVAVAALRLGVKPARGAARPPGTRRVTAVMPLASAAILWFAIGVLPLAVLLPDWNAWRAWTPTLGFAIGSAALLAAVSPWLGGAWVVLKLFGLLASPLAPSHMTKVPPEGASHESFGQLVRLQRMVGGTRHTMLAALPRLPHGARICYWEMPRLATFAFQGSRALRVWYRDSTLDWHPFGGESGLATHYDGGVEFRYDEPRVAVAIPVASIDSYQRAGQLMLARNYRAADSLLAPSIAALPEKAGAYYGSLLVNQAVCEYNLGRYAQADTLARAASEWQGSSVELWSLRAGIAYVFNDRETAADDCRRALSLDAHFPAALEMARRLGLTTPPQ